jgi:hypothetical protein
LHDQKGLLPCWHQPDEQDEEDVIDAGDGWPFPLSSEHDELVAEEGISRHQLCLASAKVSQGGERQRGHQRVGPTSQVRGEDMPAAFFQVLERGHNTSHNKSFSIM